MFEDTTISFIGGGNMAEAMIKGILGKGLVSPDRIIVSEPRSERGEQLRAAYGVHATNENRSAARQADILILSIKPQVLNKVMDEIHLDLAPNSLVLSIIAGARISVMTHGLQHGAIVRSMPNTPAQYGVGMTVWTCTRHVTERQRLQAQQILQALGKEIWMEDEEYLDMATALSGTGPAYVFLFIEALIDAGVHMGFARHIAEELVLQTIEGSLKVVDEMERHPATLRNMVTSPGGTSAAALYELEKGGFRTILSKAIFAAYRRSVELGEASEAKLGKGER